MTPQNRVRMLLEGSNMTPREPYGLGLSCQKGCGHCPHLRMLCLIAGRKTDVANIRVAGGAWCPDSAGRPLCSRQKDNCEARRLEFKSGGEERSMMDGQESTR